MNTIFPKTAPQIKSKTTTTSTSVSSKAWKVKTYRVHSLVLKSPLEARLGMRLPGQRLKGDEVHLKDARLYLPSFFPFS